MIIVDRIISGLAVCLNDDKKVDIPLAQIIGKVREGDVLHLDDSSERYSISAEETEKRRAALTERFNRIKTRGKN